MTAQPNGYVDKSQKHLMSYEVVKKDKIKEFEEYYIEEFNHNFI